MRNVLLALTTGFLAAEAASLYRAYTLNNLTRSRNAKRDDDLLDSFPASDAMPAYAPEHATKQFSR